MEITWKGQSFFEIKTKSFRGETVILGAGSVNEDSGLKAPKTEAQILLLNNNNKSFVKTKNPFLINEPGEYEVRGVLIKGIPSHGEKEEQVNVIYKIESEGIKICHLGGLKQTDLTEEQLESLGNVDILMLPIGGGNVINSKVAAEIVSQVEPRMVIPMDYKVPGIKIDIDGVDKFLKTMGAENVQPQKKLKISPRDLPKEETRIIIFSIQ